MRLLFIGIQNFLSGCGLMALLILWGLFRRLKEIEKENSTEVGLWLASYFLFK